MLMRRMCRVLSPYKLWHGVQGDDPSIHIMHQLLYSMHHPLQRKTSCTLSASGPCSMRHARLTHSQPIRTYSTRRRQLGVQCSSQSPEFMKHASPKLFEKLQLRGLDIKNRIFVSPMCMYSADAGVPNNWHLVHLGARAIGGRWVQCWMISTCML